MQISEECAIEVLELVKKYGWRQTEAALYFHDAWTIYEDEIAQQIAAGKIELERLINAAHN